MEENMKFLLVCLFFSLSPLASSMTLEDFFMSKGANSICQKALTVSSHGIRKQHLRFVTGDMQQVYFVFNYNDYAEVEVFNTYTEKWRTLKFKEKIVDITLDKSEALFLTPKNLLSADRETFQLNYQFPTLPKNISYFKHAYASGLVKAGNDFYIAHGKYGVVKYDKENRNYHIFKPEVPQPQSGHISLLVDIHKKDDLLYLSYDDLTLARKSKAFEGVVLWSLKEDKVSDIIPLNQRKEGYYRPHFISDNARQETLYIANFNLLFKHDLTEIPGSRYMWPNKRIWKHSAGDAIGRLMILDGVGYGCFEDIQAGSIGILSASLSQL